MSWLCRLLLAPYIIFTCVISTWKFTLYIPQCHLIIFFSWRQVVLAIRCWTLSSYAAYRTRSHTREGVVVWCYIIPNNDPRILYFIPIGRTLLRRLNNNIKASLYTRLNDSVSHNSITIDYSTKKWPFFLSSLEKNITACWYKAVWIHRWWHNGGIAQCFTCAHRRSYLIIIQVRGRSALYSLSDWIVLLFKWDSLYTHITVL